MDNEVSRHAVRRLGGQGRCLMPRLAVAAAATLGAAGIGLGARDGLRRIRTRGLRPTALHQASFSRHRSRDAPGSQLSCCLSWYKSGVSFHLCKKDVTFEAYSLVPSCDGLRDPPRADQNRGPDRPASGSAAPSHQRRRAGAFQPLPSACARSRTLTFAHVRSCTLTSATRCPW